MVEFRLCSLSARIVVCVFHKALVERFDRGLFYVRSVENFREAGSVIKNGVDPSLLAVAETYKRALTEVGGQERQSMKPSPVGALTHGALYVSPPYSLQVPPLSVPRLAVNITPGPVHGGFDRDRSRTFLCRRHSLFLTPAGHPVTWCKQVPSRHLGIYFQPDVFNGAGEDVPLFRTVPALFNTLVPGIGQLVDQFADELQNPGILNLEAADCLARFVLIRLLATSTTTL